MNPDSGGRRLDCGITLLEVMIVLVTLAIVAIILLAPRVTFDRSRAKRIACIGNLKQIGLSVRQWAMDHGDTYPASAAMTNGGTLGHPLFDQPWIHLRVISNELNTPLVLVCPEDRQAKEVRSFGTEFGSNNVSYFVGVDAAEEKPSMWLAGDRNLTTNGVRIPSGLHTMSTNHLLSWDRTLHNQCGNLGLADGSVQQMSSSALRQELLNYPQTNRLAIP